MLLAVMCVLLCVLTTPTSAVCPCEDARYGLVVLYDALGGDHWTRNTNWTTGSSVCGWYGVARRCYGTPGCLCVNLTSCYCRLDLVDNNLDGTLPSEVWGLPLGAVGLGVNRISGTIPDATITNNSLLHSFNVSFNGVTGSLPSLLPQWAPHLSEFDVQYNGITGTLPSSYGALRSMRHFHVVGNAMAGTLPPEYSKWDDAGSIEFTNNSFSGPLPESYGAWGASVNTFLAGVNSFTGTLPASYGNWTGMRMFEVCGNGLSGELPDYTSWTSLQYFDASHNALSSTVRGLSYFRVGSALSLFAAHSNRLTGELPATLPAGLLVLLLHSNDLSGTVPLWSSAAVVVVTLHNNTRVGGRLPQLPASLVLLSLSGTALCGAVRPSSVTLYTPDVSRGVLLYAMQSMVTEWVIDAVGSGREVAPACAAATTAAPQNVGPPQQSNGPEVAITAAARSATKTALSIGVFFVAVHMAGGTAQVLLHSPDGFRRLRQCRSGLSSLVDSSAFGSAWYDNPLRLEISAAGASAAAGGAVVGNAIMLAAMSCFAAVVCGVTQRWRGGAKDYLPMRGAVYTFVVLWGCMHVPLTAAAVLLLFDQTSVAGIVLGSFGLFAAAVPVVALLWSYVMLRRGLKGRLLGTRPPRTKRSAGCVQQVMGCAGAVYATLARQRSTWSATLGASAAKPAVLLRCLLDEVVGGCHFPYSGMLLADQCVALAEGVLLGIGSSRSATCGVVRAAAWVQFAVVAVSLLVAVVLRPRPRLIDCLLEIMMTLVTSVLSLLALVGDSDVGEEDAFAASVLLVQVILLIPVWHRSRAMSMLLARCRGVCGGQQRSDGHHEASAASRNSVRLAHNAPPRSDTAFGYVVTRASIAQDAAVGAVLRKLIEDVCSESAARRGERP